MQDIVIDLTVNVKSRKIELRLGGPTKSSFGVLNRIARPQTPKRIENQEAKRIMATGELLH